MPPRERRGTAALLAVAAAHVGVALLLLNTAVWRERAPPPAALQPLLLRLLMPETRPAPAPTPAATPVPTTPPQARRQEMPTAAPALEVPAAAALPAAPVAAPQAAVEAPRPLLLDLPRAASGVERRRNPALDDPRANTAKATIESRLAAVMGDGRWTEQLLPDGRRIYRNGAECIELQPARIEQIDGFNKSFSPKPMAAKPC